MAAFLFDLNLNIKKLLREEQLCFVLSFRLPLSGNLKF